MMHHAMAATRLHVQRALRGLPMSMEKAVGKRVSFLRGRFNWLNWKGYVVSIARAI